MKTVIKAEIVAHSINEQGDELISVMATFPRFILAEVNTHRMLSKNTSSSRAIPFNKMVETIENNPFIPIAWQKSHSGMQGTEYITDAIEIQGKNLMWLAGRDRAIKTAKDLHEADVTKQLANRLLEPFMWTTMLITGPKSGWDNFFHLRCPQYEYITKENIMYFKSKKDWTEKFYESKIVSNTSATIEDINTYSWLNKNKGQAEIHMMDLAEKIYDAMNESTPKQLKAGEWHIPFYNVMDETELFKVSNKITQKERPDLYPHSTLNKEITAVRISVAMAARTSYTVVGEEKEIDYQKMIDLHDRLLAQDPPHSSPLEHCARAMFNEEHNYYLKGDLTYIDKGLINDIVYEQGLSNKRAYFEALRQMQDLDPEVH